MDQQEEITRLLTEIRDTQRALAEDTRKVREWHDILKQRQKRVVFVLVAAIVFVVAFVVLFFTFVGYMAHQESERERTNPENPVNLNRRYKKQLDRGDESLDRWEKQADRIDGVIDKWEKAVPKMEEED